MNTHTNKSPQMRRNTLKHRATHNHDTIRAKHTKHCTRHTGRPTARRAAAPPPPPSPASAAHPLTTEHLKNGPKRPKNGCGTTPDNRTMRRHPVGLGVLRPLRPLLPLSGPRTVSSTSRPSQGTQKHRKIMQKRHRKPGNGGKVSGTGLQSCTPHSHVRTAQADCGNGEEAQ